MAIYRSLYRENSAYEMPLRTSGFRREIFDRRDTAGNNLTLYRGNFNTGIRAAQQEIED